VSKETIDILNRFRDLQADVNALREKSKVLLSKRDGIYFQFSKAEGYRFALHSTRCDSPEGPCPLSIDAERQLRKEYKKINILKISIPPGSLARGFFVDPYIDIIKANT